MEVPNHIECDVCGRAKGEANHWYIAVTFPPTAEEPGEVGIAFGLIGAPMNDPALKIEHLCGQGCALKRLAAWLEEQAAQPRKDRHDHTLDHAE